MELPATWWYGHWHRVPRLLDDAIAHLRETNPDAAFECAMYRYGLSAGLAPRWPWDPYLLAFTLVPPAPAEYRDAVRAHLALVMAQELFDEYPLTSEQRGRAARLFLELESPNATDEQERALAADIVNHLFPLAHGPSP